MTETATRSSSASVSDFIAKIDDPRKQADARALASIMSRLTGSKPRMWGPSIVGFGSYHYKYPSGHEGDSCVVGFSPRNVEFSIYLNGSHWAEHVAQRDALLQRLGKHRMGKGCLYLKRLSDVDPAILELLIKQSVEAIRSTYPSL